MEKAGNLPCIMNAANEVVVHAFLANKVGFQEMSEMIEKTMEKVDFIQHPSLEDYEHSDKEARLFANELVKKGLLSVY
jgi:1-deoxy-D-xylulose-5-phosphate reductoisomerase